jgi:selenocysteine-specific elongation factor
VVLRTDRGVAGGAVALDVEPPSLDRRGAGRRRAGELDGYPDVPDGASELRRRGIVRAGTLRAIGVEPPAPALVGDWLVAPEVHRTLRVRLMSMLAQQADDPTAAPLGVEYARKALDLPDPRLVPALLAPPWSVRDGMIVHAEAPDTLAPSVRQSVEALEHKLAGQDFPVPSEEELAGLGLGTAEVAAAVRAGRLVRLAAGVVLLPGTVDRAVTVLAGLPQPFTASEAREALGTTRKVIVPLLEHFALRGRTRRTPDGRHTVTGR